MPKPGRKNSKTQTKNLPSGSRGRQKPKKGNFVRSNKNSEEAAQIFPYPYVGRFDIIWPHEDRKHRSEFQKTREKLCKNPNFQQNILTLRKRYPPSYWAKEHQNVLKAEKRLGKEAFDACQRVLPFNVWDWNSLSPLMQRLSFTGPRVELAIKKEIESFCWAWGFQHPQDHDWIMWLVMNWDPTQDSLPPQEPKDVRPWLDHWQIKVEYCKPSKEVPQIPFRAIVTFGLGTSSSEAKKVAKMAIEALGVKGKGGRPPISDTQLSSLRPMFESQGPPQKGGKVAYRQAIYNALAKEGNPLNKQTISDVLDQWLKDNGYPPKKPYTTKRHDRRF